MCKNSIIQIAVLVNILLFNTVTSDSFIPVYLWVTSSNIPLVPALDRLSKENFKDILSEHLPSDAHIIVFAEETLSPEDFTLYNSEGHSPYSQLASIKEKHHASYFPFVQDPVNTVKLLGEEILEISLSKLVQDESILQRHKIIIVNLDDSEDSETRFQRLKRHADSIVDIYKKAAEKFNVAALYTGYENSWVIPESVLLSRKRRDVSRANGDDTRTVFNITNVLLYVNSTPTFSNNGERILLSSGSLVSNETDTTIIAVLTADSAQVLFNFTTVSGYWYLNLLTVTYNGSTYRVSTGDVYAPINFSYTCNNAVFANSNNSEINLTLPGFQVQPFFGSTQDGSFGDPYNCVGFTTIPIWSGIFVTFILALIMTFGLTFMMDIRTMDRFDDPKGKTIVINVSE